MKPTVTNCFPCWTEDQRATPATWALGDEFFCDAHIRSEGIDIGKCETIEAWRAGHGQPPHSPEVQERREVQAAAGRKNGKASAEVCKCGKPARHRGRCRKIEGEAHTPWRRAVNRASTAPSNSGRGTRPVSNPTPQNGSNHVPATVGNFKIRTVSLDVYHNEMSPARYVSTRYDPIIAHVKAMSPKTVAIIDCPKDISPKNFRNRLAHILQRANKLKVHIEQRTKENAVAVIAGGRL